MQKFFIYIYLCMFNIKASMKIKLRKLKYFRTYISIYRYSQNQNIKYKVD